MLQILLHILGQIRRFVMATFFNFGQPILNKHVGGYKTEIFTCLHEEQDRIRPRPLRILEIGAGSGMNFKYLPSGSELVCVEPCGHMRRYLRRTVKLWKHIDVVEVINGRAEDMEDVPDSSIDAVIGSFVLCAVGDNVKSLREILRVLKPGGVYCFLEHTLNPDVKTWVNWFQRLVRPFWVVMCGCDTCNDPYADIVKARFSHVTYKTGHMDTLLVPVRHLSYGVATK